MFNWFRKKKPKIPDSVRASHLQKLYEGAQDYLTNNYRSKSEIHCRSSVKTADPEIRHSLRDDPQQQTVVYANGQLSWANRSASPIPFSMRVKRYMESKRLTPTELCGRVLMDRRLFSKLNTDLSYQPSKETAVAFCIGLRLSLSEAESLLQSAGYSLSNSIKYDVIVRYLLDQQIYDIDDVNAVLYKFGEKCIGC